MSYKKFTKDIGLMGLTQVITVLSGIVTLPIITKLLGAGNYGIWVQLLVTLGLISSIAVINLPNAIVRFLPGEKDKKEIQDGIWSVFVLMLGIIIIISLLLICFSGIISKFLGCQQIFILILSQIIIFDCLNSLLASVFRAFQEIIKYCSFIIFQKIGEASLIILSVLLGYGLLGAVISMLIVRILFFLIMGGIVVRKVGIKIPKFIKIKEYLSFCLPLAPVDISYWVVQSSDKYFIGFFLGTLFVGYYAPAYTLGCYITFSIAPLGFLLPAILAKHHDENEIEKVKTYLSYSLKYFLMIAIPAVFGISVLAKPLLTTFSTAEIAQHSYFVIPFVALSMMLSGIYTIVTQNLLIKKKTKIGGAIWIAAAVLNFGLNFIFIPRFGILGAAITTLLAFSFVTVAGWYYSFKELSFKVDWGIILKSILSAVIMSIFVIWLNPVGIYRELIAVILGGLVYGVLIILLKGFSMQEIQFFKNLLKNDQS
ncbi:MAG: polysaccharide biosynthesis C-terminal domain-containing protein [Candidatus Staskawiczbacteria bacterium]|nr:polysaccharide biosynthesis C-terminal domain-containing protein [Candidatus Staskawiczbacteria bacterium]